MSFDSRLIVGPVLALSFLTSNAMSQASTYDPQRELASFKSYFGERVNVVWGAETGFVKMIYGVGADLRTGVVPRTDSEFEDVARSLFNTYPGLFGFDADALVLNRVWHLNLDDVGTSNKVGVTFHQEVHGVEVLNSAATVLFGTDGQILCIDNGALPFVQDNPELLYPQVSEAEAIQWAKEAFSKDVDYVKGSSFVIAKQGHELRPVWLIELRAIEEAGAALPTQEEFTIDAITGQILESRSTIFNVDLTGNTNGFATPGLAPDTNSNPPVSFPVALAPMSSSVGNASTNLNGDWTIPFGGTNPQNVTVNFGATAQFAEVIDLAGPEITLTQSVTPGVPSQFTLNVAQTEFDTAEMNAQRHVILFREYIKSLSPGDMTMDFQVLSNVNRDSSCNAFFDGSSINFYRESGGCVNTSFSTVVAHEEGHWANTRYNSGTSGAFNEGAADIWAMYIYDTPIVGEGFFGPGTNVRDGNNNLQKCSTDCDETCHGGGVHREGEVLMGVFWKLRDRLNVAFGDAGGDAIADDLFLSWMQVFDDRRICDEIYTHILMVDDDDGNISNGTPHCDIIAAAFEGDHGWPDIHGCSPPQDCPAPCLPTSNYGVGTPGSGGQTPQIASSNGCGYLSNRNFTIDVDNALGGAPGSFLIGFSPDNTVFGGWTRLVNPGIVIPFVTSGGGAGNGSVSLLLPIPNNPFIVGLDVYIQATIADGGASGGIAASNGLQFEICDAN